MNTINRIADKYLSEDRDWIKQAAKIVGENKVTIHELIDRAAEDDQIQRKKGETG